MSITVGGTNITMNDATVQSTAFVGFRCQVFTTSGTFTIPAGVTAIKGTVVGGGGNGGTAVTGCSNGGGGGGGATAIAFLTGLTPGNTITVTVGGASGNSTLTSGTQTISTVTGGGGSNGNNSNVSGGAMGNGGTATGGTINISGSGNSNNPTNAGGSSLFSPIQRGDRGNTTNFPGIVYGGGATGGASGGCPGPSNIAGGTGAAGIVFIEW